mgnify:CR=1 FL=1
MVVKGRFGFHPCDYETYLKLKAIKKRYWQSVYTDARHDRWERKFPKNRKGQEPPKACPHIGIRVWGWRNAPDGSKVYGKVPAKPDQHLLDWFEMARTPQATEAEVKPFMNGQLDLINEIYAKLQEWDGKVQEKVA